MSFIIAILLVFPYTEFKMTEIKKLNLLENNLYEIDINYGKTIFDIYLY